MFSLDPAGKSFRVSSPDVSCSLSFSAKTSSLLSDPVALDELPRSEMAKLDGPATIDGDSLQVSMHNGTAWELREVVIGLTIVKRPEPGSAASYFGQARIVPAVASGSAQQCRLVTKAARCNPSVASEGIGCSIGYRDLSHVLEFCALSRSGLALGDRQSQRDPTSDLAGDGADNATRKHRPTCPGRTGREHEHRATASASAERIPVVPEMQPFVVLSFFPQPLVIPGTPKAGEEPAVRLQRPNSCRDGRLGPSA